MNISTYELIVFYVVDLTTYAFLHVQGQGCGKTKINVNNPLVKSCKVKRIVCIFSECALEQNMNLKLEIAQKSSHEKLLFLQ